MYGDLNTIKEPDVLRFAGRELFQRVAVVIMMTAAVAFALQCMFVAASEAATGDSSHYYLGFVFNDSHGGNHSHVVPHRHMDGTNHQHAIEDDDDALASHVKEAGWNMALVACIIPCLSGAVISEISNTITIANSRPLRVADLHALRRPPRPPSIV